MSPVGVYDREIGKARGIKYGMTGKHFTAESNRKRGKKISKALMGHETPQAIRDKISKSEKGKVVNSFQRMHIREGIKKRFRKFGFIVSSEARKKLKFIAIRLWQDPNYREKVTKARIKGQQIKPNKSELKLDFILKSFLPNEYKLNVLGYLIISGKIPDFVNVNGKKKLIELYGDYWHRNDNPQDRINLFKKFGWDTLVVWEKELKNEILIKEKILEFNKI